MDAMRLSLPSALSMKSARSTIGGPRDIGKNAPASIILSGKLQ